MIRVSQRLEVGVVNSIRNLKVLLQVGKVLKKAPEQKIILKKIISLSRLKIQARKI